MKPCLTRFALLLPLTAAACGSETSSQLPDDTVPCPSGNCGKDTFRRAVPSRATVRIDFTRTAQRGVALQPVAPGYTMLGDHVDEINGMIDGIFEELETLVTATPEIEEDTRHRWRIADTEHAATDLVLTLETSNESDFTLSYAIGPSGFDADASTPVLTGEMHLDGSEKSAFAMTIDFDAASETLADIDLTGELQISAKPFASGGREIWYDFVAFGEPGGETIDTLTTYWVFGEDDYALEYLDTMHDSDATLFARWSDVDGRLDYHVDWADAELGTVDEISTNCWASTGSEVFYGWAVIDDGGHYVEVDGDESACAFGPLADHPMPSAEFASLPDEGEWDDLLATASPFCDDAPDDPDCVDYCDVHECP